MKTRHACDRMRTCQVNSAIYKLTSQVYCLPVRGGSLSGSTNHRLWRQTRQNVGTGNIMWTQLTQDSNMAEFILCESLSLFLLSTCKIWPLERCNLGSHRRFQWLRLQICPLCTCRSLPAYSVHLGPEEHCPILDPWMGKNNIFVLRHSWQACHAGTGLLRTNVCPLLTDEAARPLNNSQDMSDMSMWPLCLPSRKRFPHINILFAWKKSWSWFCFSHNALTGTIRGF